MKEQTLKKMKKNEQTPKKMKMKMKMKMKGKENSPLSEEKSRQKRGSIDIYAAQCGKCYKWRTIEGQEEYEEIRSKFDEEPFFCAKKPFLSCDTPADIEYDDTRVWVLDKPNIPKTPTGFKRELILRRDFSRLDAFYVTPTGKRVRSSVEAAAFLQEHPEYKGANPEDFNFAVPRVIDETIPDSINNDVKDGSC